ncbi:hypothetical protein [Desulfomicrobium salsuginis]
MSHAARGEIPDRAKERTAQRPNLVLILGTDASGKDHVAQLVMAHLQEAGVFVEKRRGWLSAPACAAESSEHKGPVRLFAERLFLRIYPLIAWALPTTLSLCILADVLAYRLLRRKPVMVVSHTALRLLAFHMGHDESFRMPTLLRGALASLRGQGLQTLFVTTERDIRIRRIDDRIRRDKVDHFDLYMARRPRHGERVTDALERIAADFLHAHTVRNDAHGDEHIAAALHEIWPELRARS